jgi:hypothetical protein
MNEGWCQRGARQQAARPMGVYSEHSMCYLSVHLPLAPLPPRARIYLHFSRRGCCHKGHIVRCKEGLLFGLKHLVHKHIPHRDCPLPFPLYARPRTHLLLRYSSRHNVLSRASTRLHNSSCLAPLRTLLCAFTSVFVSVYVLKPLILSFMIIIAAPFVSL